MTTATHGTIVSEYGDDDGRAFITDETDHFALHVPNRQYVKAPNAPAEWVEEYDTAPQAFMALAVYVEHLRHVDAEDTYLPRNDEVECDAAGFVPFHARAQAWLDAQFIA